MPIESVEFTALNEFVSKEAPICYGILKPGQHVENGVPVVKVKDINDGKISTAGLLHTSTEIDSQYKRSRISEGDILLTIRGTTGRVALVPSVLESANITQDTARIRVSSQDDPIYLYYALQSSNVQRQIVLNTVGQAVKGINIAEVRKLKIFHPNPKIQTGIAQILATWDKAIETTAKMIENSRSQKKALMQQLLTGKRRLPVFAKTAKTTITRYGRIPQDWKFVAITEIANEESERAGDNASYPVLSCSKYDGFVDSLKYFNKKVYSENTSNYKVVRRGSFGFPSNHIEEGSIGYQHLYEAGIVSPIYSVFRTNSEVHDDYLYKLLKTDHYRQIFQANTNASVDRRGSLRWKEFGKIRIPLPTYEEQEKIASVISIAEQELLNLEQQRTNLQLQKRALMQQLLTGKKRVKVSQ